MRLGGALLFLGCALAACHGAPAPSEPRIGRAPATSLAELFPDDLDFVVRIGAARIRQNPALAGVVRDIAKQQPSELLASMQSSLGEAAAVWVGTRWMSDGFHGDGVVAIETPPGSEAPPLSTREAPSWRSVAIAGPPARGAPHVDVFERAAKGRADAVLRVVMEGRGVLLATAAEADAVTRVLYAGPDPKRLEPPERGLLSFAGTSRVASPLEATVARGTLRELTQGLVGYAGVLDEAREDDRVDPGGASAEGLELDASLTYSSAIDATRAAERAKELAARLRLAGGSLGSMANSMRLTEVGNSVQVRLKVPFAWLAQLH